MLFRWIALGALAIAALGSPAVAASSTTCLCRTADGAAFAETIRRHHRWACDYHFGYVRSTDPEVIKANPEWPDKRRPGTQTCNTEEIVQFKVYLCASGGCTYPYARSSETANSALRKVVPLQGGRRP